MECIPAHLRKQERHQATRGHAEFGSATEHLRQVDDEPSEALSHACARHRRGPPPTSMMTMDGKTTSAVSVLPAST